MTRHHLMPQSATALEMAISESIDRLPEMYVGTNALRWPQLSQSSSALPYLILERGLSGVTQYVSNFASVLSLGTAWQRVRGTPKAIELGLNWIGYTAFLKENKVYRRRWHLFQLGLSRTRDNEDDLEKIEGISVLSSPARSHFFRGFHGYDIPPLELSRTKFSGALLSKSSGVRTKDGGALWSFGRKHDLDVALTQAELETLEVWIGQSGPTYTWDSPSYPFSIPVFPFDSSGNNLWIDPLGATYTWEDLDLPWTMATFPWNAATDGTRRRLMAALVAGKSCWVEFKDSSGAVIGYRKARAVHSVAEGVNGKYSVGSVKYAKSPDTEIIYIEAMTDFGDGNGQTAATAALRFDAAPVDQSKPGILWVGPNQLTMPRAAVAIRNVSIPFGRTVRERVSTLLRITA